MDKVAELTQELKKLATSPNMEAALFEPFYRYRHAPKGHKLNELGRGVLSQTAGVYGGLLAGGLAGYGAAALLGRERLIPALVGAYLGGVGGQITRGLGAPDRMAKSVDARNKRRAAKILKYMDKISSTRTSSVAKIARVVTSGNAIDALDALYKKRNDLEEAASLGIDVNLKKFDHINEKIKKLYNENKDQIDTSLRIRGLAWGSALGGSLGGASKVPAIERTLKLLEGFPKDMRTNVLKRLGMRSLIPAVIGAIALGASAGYVAPKLVESSIN